MRLRAVTRPSAHGRSTRRVPLVRAEKACGPREGPIFEWLKRFLKLGACVEASIVMKVRRRGLG